MESPSLQSMHNNPRKRVVSLAAWSLFPNIKTTEIYNVRCDLSHLRSSNYKN